MLQRSRSCLFVALIFLITFFSFFPVLQNGFVNWDDDFNLLLNDGFRGLGWEQIKWAFTTFYMGHYQPLSWLTLSVDYVIWVLDPKGYHLTALFIHALNSVILYFIVFRLLDFSFPRQKEGSEIDRYRVFSISAFFSALFFAVHPLRVESVAWATERRDVLSGFFILWTVLYYLKACETGGASLRLRRLGWAVFFYLLSLLSKGIGVSLPAILVCLDIFPLNRLTWNPLQWGLPVYRKVWAEKLPFAFLAIAAGCVGVVAQVTSGATDIYNLIERPNLMTRVFQALYAISFYFWKTFVPIHLLPLYERSSQMNGLTVFQILGAISTIILSVIFFSLKKRWPGLLTMWLVYIASLVPILQVLPFGPYIVADRYTYLSCMCWAVLVGGVMVKFSKKGVIIPVLASAWVIGLSIMTWNQVKIWESSESLWRAVLEKNPNSSLAHSNLGVVLLDDKNNVEEAALHFAHAIQIRPSYYFAIYNYGKCLDFLGKLEEAIEQYQIVLQMNPSYSNAHYNLASIFMRKNRIDEAIEHYQSVIKFNPNYVDAHFNLGKALFQRNRLDEAIEQYQMTLLLVPSYIGAHNNLGIVYLNHGQAEKAKDQFFEELKINPLSKEAHDNLSSMSQISF